MTRHDPTEKRYIPRIFLVAIATTVLFCLIAARLFTLQITRHEYYKKRAENIHTSTIKISPQRAGIFSSDGYPLAISSLVDSAYMSPEYIELPTDEPRFVPRLAHTLAFSLFRDGLSAGQLEKITKRFEKSLNGDNRLSLTWTRSKKEKITFRGKVNEDNMVSVLGTIDGTSLTLEGVFERGKDFTLAGETPKGDTIFISGKSSTLRRSFDASANLAAFGKIQMRGLISQKPVFVLKKKITEAEKMELIALRDEFNLPRMAMYFLKEGKRQYPSGSLAAHVIGYTTSNNQGDNSGKSGAERTFNESLNGVASTDKIEVTNFGQGISPIAQDALTSATGNNIYLTINKTIQQTAEKALAIQVREYDARGGICVVMDIPTGAILAMASYPTFDLNVPPSDPNQKGQINQCVQAAIPPGSVMKIFTSVALLEAGKMSPGERINLQYEDGWPTWGKGHKFENGTAGKHIVNDSHKVVDPIDETLPPTVETVFAQSSNVAYVHLGLRMDPTEFYEYLMKFGFNQKTNIDLPWERLGTVKPPTDWYKSDHISISFGSGLMLTPIQVTAALAAVANDGHYMQPHILKEIRSAKNELISRFVPHKVNDICSPQTSEIMIRMMEEVVMTGTGENAALSGYRVGGKTGTTRDLAKSAEKDPYYYASFAGIIPLDKPRLAIYSWVDDPQGAKYGGTVTAPVFRAVAAEATRILGIRPAPQVATSSSARPKRSRPPLAEKSFKAGMALPPPQSPGTAIVMPDLHGKTLREVVMTLNRLKIDAQLVDWGVAISQQPPPGEQLAANERSLVVFGPPNESTQTE